MQSAIAHTVPRRSLWRLALRSLAATALAGTLWTLLEVYTQCRLSVLALPLGWLLGRVARHGLETSPWLAATLAAGMLILATLYQACLLTGWLIASGLGLDWYQALQDAGLGTLCYIAKLATTPLTWLNYGLGTWLAIWSAHLAKVYQGADAP